MLSTVTENIYGTLSTVTENIYVTLYTVTEKSTFFYICENEMPRQLPTKPLIW